MDVFGSDFLSNSTALFRFAIAEIETRTIDYKLKFADCQTLLDSGYMFLLFRSKKLDLFNF